MGQGVGLRILFPEEVRDMRLQHFQTGDRGGQYAVCGCEQFDGAFSGGSGCVFVSGFPGGQATAGLSFGDGQPPTECVPHLQHGLHQLGAVRLNQAGDVQCSGHRSSKWKRLSGAGGDPDLGHQPDKAPFPLLQHHAFRAWFWVQGDILDHLPIESDAASFDVALGFTAALGESGAHE